MVAKIDSSYLISPALSGFAKALVANDNTLDIFLNTGGGAVQVNAGGLRQTIASQPIAQDLQAFIADTFARLDPLISLNFRFVNDSLKSDINFYFDSTIDVGQPGVTLGIAFNNTVAGRNWTEILLNGNALKSQPADLVRYTIVHEFLHSLGLEHPFDASDGDFYLSTNSSLSAYADDTVMAYRNPRSGAWPTSLTNSDFEALLQIWGPQGAETSRPGSALAVYRLYNSSSGEHLFTTSQAEIDILTGLPRGSFVNEGVAYSAPANGNQAVYRFLQATTGLHFYTANDAEKDSLIANPGQGYQYEGAAFYVNGAASAPAGATPVFRFYDSANGKHFYTASAGEVASVRSTLPSWTYEGAAWYA